MTMTIRNIRLFLGVAEELHFSAAAKRMNIAQPALSRAIKTLEESLGAALFKRSTRKVELTQAGQVLQQGARDALDRLDVAVRQARKASAGEAGTLTIAYMDFAIEGEFPSILREFRSHHPSVTVQSKASFTDKIIEDLKSGRIDAGFVVGPMSNAGLSSMEVQQDKFVAVVPETHPLARKSSIKLKSLADEPFVLGRKENWAPYVRRVDALCRQAGFVPNVVQEADTTPSILAFVASGIGSTLYVERAFHYDPPGIKILALEDVDATVSTEVAWRSDDESVIVQNFVATCTRTDQQ